MGVIFDPILGKLRDSDTGVIISGGLVPKGAYNALTDYAVGDSVDYQGSSYVMFNNAPAGTLPTNTTYWQVIASKGATGATGATGAAGADGADGVGIPVGGTTGQVLQKASDTDYDTEWGSGTGGATVDSVNGETGDVILTQDDIGDGTTYKQYSDAEKTKLAGIEDGAEVNTVDSVNGHTGVVTVTKSDVSLGNVDNVQQVPLSYLDTDNTLAANSDTKVASQKAIKGYVDTGLGTKQNSLGFTAENVANKDTDGTLAANSDTKYASQKATKTYADTKVAGNTAITGATKTKITYDTKGLVTAGADATTADIADSSNKRYVTDAQLTVIGNTSGTNTGDATTTTEGALINGATAKTTPVDADYVGLMDSAASNILKKLSWANIKATLKTYFDTLYPSGSGTSTGTNTGDQTTVSGNAGSATVLQTARNIDGQSFNGSADITVIAPGTHAATSKATPVDADELPLVDSAASNVLKKLTWANLKATAKTYFDTLYQPLDSDLTTIAGLTATTDNFIVSVASAWASRTPSQVRTTLGLVIGTNVQAWDADLDSWAGKTAPSGTPVGTSDTQTLTNKRITARVNNAASYTTSVTIDSDSYDTYEITAQAGALLFNNPSGTPTAGQKLMVRIKDNGTARALTYGSQFRGGTDVTLPSTTVLSKTLYMGFMWNAADSKWDIIAKADGY